jgi:hypothetical protein
LERIERPVWPWAKFEPGIMVEAFPAAQLKLWDLPHYGYSEPQAANIRNVILRGLRERVRLSSTHADIAIKYADALDAIIAVFAAIAVSNNSVAGFEMPYEDGFIAVAN